MLPLDSPRWGQLAQAFGSAEDVPRLLAQLDLVDDAGRRELWMALWALLAPEGRTYTAAYGATPHLVAWAARRPAADRALALHLVAAVELTRGAPDAPPLPDDLAGAYAAAMDEVPAVIAASAGEPWDPDTTQVLVSVLAIAKGHPAFGGAALRLEGW
ncbi:MAG TPA: hypothetical protein VFY16_07720 [Gemmatimonadaceae bacterium]|nr:hypothetical protein [Gemmatimonadaceae bacterium]